VRGEVDSRRSRRANLYTSSAHYAFTLTETRDVSITLKIVEARDPAHADLDLLVFNEKGDAVEQSVDINGVGGVERVDARLPPGRYRIEVRSWSNSEDAALTSQTANQGTYTLFARY
jgi:hypothetical protein